MSANLGGYLDVKVPSGSRKRGFTTPWKAWRRQWCQARPSGDGDDFCVEVLVGGGSAVSCFKVLPDSTLCRSESRSRRFAFGVFQQLPRRPSLFLAGSSETESQCWMGHIRGLLHNRLLNQGPHTRIGDGDFAVSSIDNSHSRAAGLAGYYGTLSVGASQVTLRDPHTKRARTVLRWKQLLQFHLAATSDVVDKDKICVLHTSSEFCAGAGQLYLFCGHRAPRLLEALLSRGRQPQRLLSSPLPSPPLPLRRAGRRLSRSESDLRSYWGEGELPAVLLRSHGGSRDSGVRVSTASEDSGHGSTRGKLASGLISAGLGLVFSTPGCSEVDAESLHEYQRIGDPDSDEDAAHDLSLRRESGVYEEIAESSAHYEDPAFLRLASPPPLPPRRKQSFTGAVGRCVTTSVCGGADPLCVLHSPCLTFQRGAAADGAAQGGGASSLGVVLGAGVDDGARLRAHVASGSQDRRGPLHAHGESPRLLISPPAVVCFNKVSFLDLTWIVSFLTLALSSLSRLSRIDARLESNRLGHYFARGMNRRCQFAGLLGGGGGGGRGGREGGIATPRLGFSSLEVEDARLRDFSAAAAGGGDGRLRALLPPRGPRLRARRRVLQRLLRRRSLSGVRLRALPPWGGEPLRRDAVAVPRREAVPPPAGELRRGALRPGGRLRRRRPRRLRLSAIKSPFYLCLCVVIISPLISRPDNPRAARPSLGSHVLLERQRFLRRLREAADGSQRGVDDVQQVLQGDLLRLLSGGGRLEDVSALLLRRETPRAFLAVRLRHELFLQLQRLQEVLGRRLLLTRCDAIKLRSLCLLSLSLSLYLPSSQRAAILTL